MSDLQAIADRVQIEADHSPLAGSAPAVMKEEMT
jgi:hypothetical protein